MRECAKRCFTQEIPQPCEEVKPLVIRANAGDTLVVTFSHSLNRSLSIHVQGLAYDVQTSDGASVGRNRDTTTRNQITYTWYAVQEGVYLFSDIGDTRSSEEGTNVHGLFGAVIVEAPASWWLDPHTGLPSSTTAISYRSEPMRNRLPLTHDHADTGEDISMSSWVYGDPAPPILRAYVGDPSKIRLIRGGIKETHVFHLHNHQWRLEGNNPNSTIIDSISISPQECYTLDILHGAGSLNGTIGDVIFHCHLYPHFHEGMWTLWRIHDRLEDGSGRLPDGTPVPSLLPLKDRKAPPRKDALHPGYPNFINGTFGEPPLQPPLGILDPDGSNKIEPTPLEEANFVPGFEPVPGSHDDPGVMGINYRCEPMRERLKCHEDPAYLFSSLIHGDYLYCSGSLGWDVESGMWGIFRVLRQSLGCRCRNTCRRIWSRVCEKNENTRQ